MGNAAVAADSIPPLMVLMQLSNSQVYGHPTCAYFELIIDMNKTCIQHDELIACIRIPRYK